MLRNWLLFFPIILLNSFLAITALADRPNIVLIYADDIGYGDLACYGAKTIPTPNIDKLAENGTRFTSGYATSATCTPSRFSLLTGEYAWRAPGRGIAPPNSTTLIKPGTPTIASVLQSAGYRTGLIGKWHLGLGSSPKPNWSGEIKPGPNELGFDECFIIPTTNDRVPCVYVRNHHIIGMTSDDPVEVYDKNPDGQPTGISNRSELRMNWTHEHNDSVINGIGRIGFMTGGHKIRWRDEDMGDVLVHEAKDFLSRSANESFFLFFSAHQVHVPRAPNERFIGSTPHGPRGDAIVEFDWCVGQLVEELERQKVLDNTLIIITSDNGPVLNDGYDDKAAELLGDHKPAGPFRGGKYSRFEGGTRVPWLVHWPSKIKPSVSDALVSQVDLFSTLASIADAGTPDGSGKDSQNIVSAFLGDDLIGRETLIEHGGFGQKLAIRKGNWKYIQPSNGPHENIKTNTELANRKQHQLYNLEEDPGEQKNLFETFPEIGESLRNELEAIVANN